MPEKLRILDSRKVADILQVKPFTLYTWRISGKGPKYAKIGRKILYSVNDIENFIQSKKEASR